MAKAFGIHPIEMHPGVKGEDFERFFREQAASAPMFPGWSWRLLKGDKGERAGQYMVLFEMESVEARDRFAPPSGETSQETEQFMEAHKAIWNPIFEKWATFTPTQFSQNPHFTDYVVIEA